MAQRVIQQLVDDITGKEIPAGEGENIRFAVNGTEYEIDLDEKNTKKFHDAMAFYIDHGRRVGRSNVSPIRRGRGKADQDFDPQAVRKWAEANGYEVSPRGRIKGEVVEALKAAGN